MADKQISELSPATVVQLADLFVMEQDGTAKKLTGEILKLWLLALADGHGGITAINISSSGTSGDGQLHTITIVLADESETTLYVRDGWKGDTGDASYLHIKYSSDLPTQDSDMSDYPDNYIGLYSGTASTAPSHYTDYTWFAWKGNTGATGAAARIVSQSVTYLTSESGTVVPEGSWQSTVPSVTPGYFLWTRTRVKYNDEDETEVTSYSVSRYGIDGQGSVASVNGVSPDPNGDIALTASDIPTSDSTSVQQHLTTIESDISTLQTYEVRHVSGQLTSLPASFSYAFITANHRIINVELGTPSAITSDLSWVTSAGDVTFSGTMANLATTTIDFDIVKVISP